MFFFIKYNCIDDVDRHIAFSGRTEFEVDGTFSVTIEMGAVQSASLPVGYKVSFVILFFSRQAIKFISPKTEPLEIQYSVMKVSFF